MNESELDKILQFLFVKPSLGGNGFRSTLVLTGSFIHLKLDSTKCNALNIGCHKANFSLSTCTQVISVLPQI